MVDFNRDATITTPPGEILKIAILERRAYFINAVEEYDKVESRGGAGSDHVVKAALRALFLEIQSALKNDKLDKTEEFIAWKKRAVEPENVADAIALFDELDAWMYAKNLTKFDTRAKLLSYDVEGANLYNERG